MIEVQQGEDRDEVVVSFSGGLDLRGAEQLVTLALQQPPSRRVVFDVSRASSVHDSALGKLCDALPRNRPHSFRGVNRHQARVLSCFGETIEAPPSDGETR